MATNATLAECRAIANRIRAWLWVLCLACAAGTANGSKSTCIAGLSRDARNAVDRAADERVRECERLDRRLPLHPPSRFWACLYGNALDAMGEGTLWADSDRESYRFLWMRSFHEPVMVRVDRTREGDFVTAKTLDGAGGYAPGCVNRDVHRRLSTEEIEGLLARYRTVFATPLPASSPDRIPVDANGQISINLDGAHWVFEKAGQSVRIIRDLWSPSEPQLSAYRELCLYMVRLSGFDIPEKDIY